MRRMTVLFLALFLVLGVGVISAQKITLTVALMSSDAPETYDKLMRTFEEQNSDISIDFTSLPDDVEAFMMPKAASGELPDFLSINGGSFGSDLVEKGLILDLRGTFAEKNTVDAVKPQFTSPSGKLFGIAGGVSTTVIYYQVKVFKDLGLTPPENWEDFLVLCEKLKKAGKTAIIMTPADGTIANTMWSWGFANNVVAKYPDYAKRFRAGTMPLDTPEFADVWAKAKVLYDKGYTQEGAVSTLYMDGNQMYIQGKSAQHFAGSWLAGSLLKTDFDTGIYMPPWNAKGKTKVPIVATETGWAVAEGPHKKQALRFLDFMAGKGFYIYQNGRGNIPMLKDPMGPVSLDQRMKDYLNKLYSYKQTSGLWFEFIPAATMQLIPKLYQEVLLGQKTPREAAAAFDKAAKDAVKK